MKRLLARKVFVAGAVLLIASGLAYVIWGGLEENLVYFLTPTELLGKGNTAVGAPVRLGGVVAPNTVHFDSNVLTFEISDDQRAIRVVTVKAPPQMFQEGMGVVVEGALEPDGNFSAERLMVKHGNEYRPPREGELPREIFRQLKE